MAAGRVGRDRVGLDVGGHGEPTRIIGRVGVRSVRFRVFYDVYGASRTVQVLAVAVKDGNRRLIGGEEYDL